MANPWLENLKKHPAGRIWLLGSVIFTLLAIMWFVFDIKRILCAPDAWVQPHALWHVCDAGAAGCYYGYMRHSGKP